MREKKLYTQLNKELWVKFSEKGLSKGLGSHCKKL